MRTFVLTHLGDDVLGRDLHTVVSKECSATATILAHIAEFDARRLYLSAGFPSMFVYCVEELHLSEDSAYKRIRAARTARRFPEIFDEVDKGRLHLAAVVLLTPHLTEATVDELLGAAVHKSKTEIERLIATRFPLPDLPVRVQPVLEQMPQSVDLTKPQLAPGPVAFDATELVPTPARVEAPAPPRPKIAPLSPQRYALQVTIGQSTHDNLRYAQEMLRHQVPSGDVAEVLDRALDLYVKYLEKQKFAATCKPRPCTHGSSSTARHVPAHVKRAVWRRDQGQCTYISENGQRCRSREFLEFDHIDPVARGGEATVEGMRLRCRGHNQLEAERMFGTEFMNHKRQEARRLAAAPVG